MTETTTEYSTGIITPQAPVAPVASISTASASAAALAKASVEARYQVALYNPRNWDSVRLKVLQTCQRPAFAERARYSKPVGGERIVGPSIRFAEVAAQCMGNLLPESAIVHEDEKQRVIRVTVTDLESNLTYSTDILVEKLVERKYLKKGQTAIKQRLNSKGETVYLVEATEDDMLNKVNSHTSKALRNAVLRLLPGDILDEAMETVISTVQNRDAQDPAAARKKICDGFYAMGVSPENLVEYLGHAIDQASPAQLQDLRQVYAAIRDGEATWAQIIEAKNGATPNGNGKPKPSRADALKESLLATEATNAD